MHLFHSGLKPALRRWLLSLVLGCCSLSLYAEDVEDTVANSDPEATGQTAGEEAETPRPALRSRHQLELDRLQQTYPEQFRSLDSDSGHAAALYLPANRPTARGWVILVPGTGQPADSTFNIERLRRILPDSGWHTLSLQLPPPAFAGLHVSAPPRIQTTTSEETGSAEEEPAAMPDQPIAPDTALPEAANGPALQEEPSPADVGPDAPAYSVQILALLDAAVAMAAEQQPASLVLLGQQEGAYWVALWADTRDAGADALMLLHAREVAEPPSLDQLVGGQQLPIADFYPALEPGALTAARQRLDSSRRNPDSQLRQTALREPAQALHENELVRRVKGWLTNLDAK